MAMLQDLRHDLSYATRALWRQPGFTLGGVLTLALGIGVNAAVFSIVNGVLLRPLPYAEPDRLLRVYETNRGQGLERGDVSEPMFADLSGQARSFGTAAAFLSLPTIVVGAGDPVEVETTFVLRDFFGTLGVGALIGRPLDQNDDRLALRNAVISERFWRTQFESNPDILGSGIVVFERSYTVVGVMPRQFRFPTTTTDVWTPRSVLTVEDIGPSDRRTRRLLGVVARLAPETSPEQAQNELEVIAARIAAENPTSNAGWSAAAVPLRTTVVGNIDRALLAAGAVVGAILLIVCVNLANMFLARGATRSREMAVRLAIGATRRRVIRLVLTEAVLLALAGGVLGIVLSLWAVQAVLAQSAGTLPRVEDVRVDGRVLAFSFIITLVTGMAFGLIPAIQGARPMSLDSLRDGRAVGSHSRRVQRVLVVAEFGLAAVLVVCAALMVRSFLALQRVDPGFDPSRVLAITLPVNVTSGTQMEAQIVQRREGWIARVGAVPGVIGVGTTTGLPLREQCRDFVEFTRGDGSRAPDGALLRANYCLASSGYLKAVGIPLLRGAPLPDTFVQGHPIPAVVSETGAKRFWPDREPVGQHVRVMSGGKFAWEHVIVGVVGDVRQLGLREDAPPLFYFTQVGFPRAVYTLVVRTAGDPGAVVGSIRQAVRDLDPQQPIRSISTLEEVLWESIARDRFFTILFSAVGGLAVVLAAVGVYSVLAYSVATRTPEIGLRMALGARASDILRLVIGAGMRLVLVGVALGTAGSLWVSRGLRSQLYGVSHTDWIALMTSTAVLVVVAFLGCYVPARRAINVTPTAALRSE